MGNHFNKKEMEKSRNFDKSLGKQKWDKLVEIINHSRLEKKKGNNNAMIIGIKHYDEIDIELFPILSPVEGEFVHIQIWGHPCQNNHHQRIQCSKTLTQALNCINSFVSEIEYFADKKR